MKPISQFYAAIVRVLSVGVLGTLLGIITGVDINILTDPEQSSQNKISIYLFALTVIPILLMMPVREAFQEDYNSRIKQSSNYWKEWIAAVSPGFNKNNNRFIACLVALAALITFGIILLKPLKQEDITLNSEFRKLKIENEHLAKDTAFLRNELTTLHHSDSIIINAINKAFNKSLQKNNKRGN